MIFYFNAPPKEFGIKTHFKEKKFGHYIKKGSRRTVVNPTFFNKKNISLKNLDQLKKKLNIERIYVFDRISGLNKNILISDHINRSGVCFLRGETPYKKNPCSQIFQKSIYVIKKRGVLYKPLVLKNLKTHQTNQVPSFLRQWQLLLHCGTTSV